ncbi:MAG TPA: GWxTD domain-containing protein [Bacteroidales bacterium]|nr:GWxTD domain-containing protein [Bacteroidales bacterium]
MNFIKPGLMFIVLLAVACKPLNEIALRDLSKFYEPQDVDRLLVNTINLNDTLSHAVIAFNPEINSSGRILQGDTTKQVIRIAYVLYKSLNSASVADSGTLYNEFAYRMYYGLPLSLGFDFKAPAGSNYMLHVQVTDANQGRTYEAIIPVDKNTYSSSGWYLLTNDNNNQILEHYLPDNETVNLKYLVPGQTKLWGKYYNKTYPPALPPFVMEMRERVDYDADSTFQIMMEERSSVIMNFTTPGLYYLRSDTTGFEGFTVPRFYDGYPLVNTPFRMIESVRYITSGEEYEQLINSRDHKVAIDSFWVKTGGNLARGLELIRQYYGRVEVANRLFSSFCEGWKTDRGMIYIVFGAPNIVYRSGRQEEWIYGEVRNYRSIHCVFEKVDNPFTDEDYVLQRQPNFREFWYMAVQQWRR